MREIAAARRALDEAMARRGDWPERSCWIREAVAALPRDAFAPDRLWRWDGRAWQTVDRATNLEGWVEEVYGSPDVAAVTQLIGDLPSSSLSCQAVVVDMLDSLLVEPGHQVLELGTGTGWNAALLAHRAGAHQVVSIETDQELAAQARARLTAAGTAVEVLVADGMAGCPARAPFDRLIATFAVERVPWAWVEQVRPGGRIVAPWGRLGHVALTVAADHCSASGWVQGLAQFMPARTVLAAEEGFAQVRGTRSAEDERDFPLGADALRTDRHLQFALRVMLPDVHITTAVDEDGTNAWIHDGAASWAVLSAQPGGRTTAHQGGPRRLADALEDAWNRWRADGAPELYDWGLTVTPDRQYAWCHDPVGGPCWPTLALATSDFEEAPERTAHPRNDHPHGDHRNPHRVLRAP